MVAANSLYPYGLCSCYGRLTPVDSEQLACEQCGEIYPLHDPADLTEEETDLFNIPQGQCTALELEPMPWGGRDRGDWDALDDKSDLLPWTKTTHY